MYNVINGDGEIISTHNNKGRAVTAAFDHLTSDGGCSEIDLSMANDGDVTRIFVGNTDSGIVVIKE